MQEIEFQSLRKSNLENLRGSMPRTPLEVSPAFGAGSPRPHFKTRSAGPGLSIVILGNIFRFVNKINKLPVKRTNGCWFFYYFNN